MTVVGKLWHRRCDRNWGNLRGGIVVLGCTEKINLSKLVNMLSNQTSFGLSN